MRRRPIASPDTIRFTRLALAVVWLTAFAATHVPGTHMPALYAGDELLHFIGFFCLASILMLGLFLRGRQRRRRVVTALVVMVLYGALDELTQPLVNRGAAWGDWLADVGGAVAAVLVWELALAWRNHAARWKW